MNMIINKFIMTFDGAPEARRANAEELATQIEGKVYVGGRHTLDNFQAILEECKNTDLLMLEDDVTLCKDFTNLINQEITDKPTDIINFHECVIKGGRYLPLSVYTGLQCVYIPNNRVKELLDWGIKEFRLKQPNLVDKNDHEKLLQILPGMFYATKYCLVCQHEWKSEIFKNHIDIHTNWFIDEVNNGDKD